MNTIKEKIKEEILAMQDDAENYDPTSEDHKSVSSELGKYIRMYSILESEERENRKLEYDRESKIEEQKIEKMKICSDERSAFEDAKARKHGDICKLIGTGAMILVGTGFVVLTIAAENGGCILKSKTFKIATDLIFKSI